MIYRIVKGWIGQPSVGTRCDLSLHTRATCLEMLTAACHGSGECPAWVIMEFEASDNAQWQLPFDEEREGKSLDQFS